MNNTSQTIGKYIIERELAHDDLGTLYVAYDPKLDRRVAIRVYAGIESDGALQERLFRYARALAKLDHPNIVRILDLDVHNKCPYIVTEFVDGDDLQTAIEKKLFIPFAQKLQVIGQTCQGLHYAHGKGIVHGGIIPSSIRIDSEGRPKISDFPVEWTSEQNSNRELACTKDLLSVSAVLYQFITYVHPFNTLDGKPESEMSSGSYKPLQEVLPACAPEFCEILWRALDTERGRGFLTCFEFVDALQSFLTTSDSHAKALYNDLIRVETEVDNYRKGFVELNIVELFDSPSDAPVGVANLNDTNPGTMATDYGELLHRHAQIQQKLQLLSEKLKGSLPLVQLLHTSYGQFKRGEFDNCQQTLQELLRVCPRNSLAQRLLKACGTAIAEAERQKEHEKRLKRALKQAREAADREQFSRATLILDRILAIEPSEPEARLLLDVVNRSKLAKNS